jgi:hypothetical protein
VKRSLLGAALFSVLGLPALADFASAQSAMPAAPSSGATPAVKGATSNQKSQPALLPTAAVMPLAPQVKGARPRVNTKVLAPAATTLAPGLENLAAPPSLGLPVKPIQVSIQELRPISLRQSVTGIATGNTRNQAQVGENQLLGRLQVVIALEARGQIVFLLRTQYGKSTYGLNVALQTAHRHRDGERSGLTHNVFLLHGFILALMVREC